MLLGPGCKFRAVSGALLCPVQILLLVLVVRHKFVWGMFLPLQCATFINSLDKIDIFLIYLNPIGNPFPVQFSYP